jgi:hypothetical protein
MGVARTVTIGAAALVISCIRVQAECWTPLPPCASLKQNTVVVLAEVLGPRDSQDRSEGPWFDVRLRVIERFKGVPPSQAEIQASFIGTAESIVPARGRTYLVYANVAPSGQWNTSCSRTRPVTATDDDEVRVLRQCVTDGAR